MKNSRANSTVNPLPMLTCQTFFRINYKYDDIELDNGVNALTYNINGIGGTISWYYVIVAHNDSTPLPFYFNIYTNAGNPDPGGAFNINWDASSGAVDFELYQSDEFIYDINGSCVKIVTGNTNRSMDLSGYADGTYYFAAVAFNGNENRTTKCIQVNVELQPPGDLQLTSNFPDSIFDMSNKSFTRFNMKSLEEWIIDKKSSFSSSI